MCKYSCTWGWAEGPVENQIESKPSTLVIKLGLWGASSNVGHRTPCHRTFVCRHNPRGPKLSPPNAPRRPVLKARLGPNVGKATGGMSRVPFLHNRLRTTSHSGLAKLMRKQTLDTLSPFLGSHMLSCGSCCPTSAVL